MLVSLGTGPGPGRWFPSTSSRRRPTFGSTRTMYRASRLFLQCASLQMLKAESSSRTNSSHRRIQAIKYITGDLCDLEAVVEATKGAAAITLHGLRCIQLIQKLPL